MKNSFLKGFFPWRRCPLLRQKVEIQRAFRISSVIQNRVQKNNKEYIMKGVEVILDTEILNNPIFKDFDEIFIMEELIDFFLYRDDFEKIKDKKYQLRIVICVSQILIKRILIPYFLKIFLTYLNKE